MKFVINLGIFVLMMLPLQGYPQMTVRFKPHVDRRASTLGDVLLIEPDHNHWSELPLLSHPQPGDWISKQQVLQWVTQQGLPWSYQWLGTTRVRVMPEPSKRPPKPTRLVKRGQMIKICRQYRRITVWLNAIALNDGTQGQTITVKNPQNQKTMRAQVTGIQQAEVVS